MKWLRRKDDHQTTPSIEQQQSEKLAELGSQLCASRQDKGLSLEEMVGLTRIPRRLLQAIEEGNLDDLPEPIYLQGLIRQFADALGFNGAEFASTFPIGTQRVTLQSTWKNTPIEQLRPIHLYLLYIFLILFSINGLSQLLNNAALQANNSQIRPIPQKQSVLTPKLTQPNNSPEIQPVSSNKEGQSVQIGVTLKSSSWIRVIADGKTEFEGILPEGTRRTWKATQQLTVKTDNAGGVLMSVNQEEAKEMGEPGTVEEVKIAAKPKS
ncbi:helix-turn-helix domain-containing protein [Cylindrospermum sp. FACHB-282]|uniref:helix-turn-helix domain-containing protein n=1 Tax=Cylindrospermum sp. FACHB-282 TaxID=2692794 RepID=UPI0016839A64|nr:RodZ domain-containing protein [Cylindrospermum sp. FACHB-282]MBD2384552.1 helix-turn-helix domain-containing protein [Cylindrospermum sp. FACHB-282]